jgi:alpha-galactosidase
MKKTFLLLIILVNSFLSFGQGNNYVQNYKKYDGLALTPPMGWNSWNKFACNVDEKMIKEIADAIISSGLKDAGYTYINIDDCWHGDRDSLGFIHPDPKRFPSGMKALADYIHSKGLKFGIYSDAGSQTCGGRPGSRGYEFQDAMTYAKWGVDYLKYDWCNTEGLKAEGAYKTMTAALRKAGRPIVLSICEWGNDKPWEWGQSVGHLWRTTGDIYNCFDCIEDHGSWKSWGVMQIVDKQEGLRQYAGPGHWNDPDMLEVGNGMVANEDRAHFSIWAMLAAPLIAGNDLRNMSKETIEILTNKDVISVNQDALGIQGFKLSVKDSLETWFKPLDNGNWAVCFLNRSKSPKAIDFDWKGTTVNDDFSKRNLNAATTVYKIRNLWTKKEMGNSSKNLKATVPAHDVLMIKLEAGQPTKSAKK